jgi:hypothetical protein
VRSYLAHKASGAPERPAFPAFLIAEDVVLQNPGAMAPREGGGLRELGSMSKRPIRMRPAAKRDCDGTLSMMRVSCNFGANAIAGFRPGDDNCHEAVMRINESNCLMVYSSSALRLKIIQGNSSLPSCGTDSARPHPHPCNFWL